MEKTQAHKQLKIFWSVKGNLLLLLLLSSCAISAQLAITPGAQFSIVGNLQLSLQNTDLLNNGNFTTGNSVITFKGNISSSIRGSGPIQFFEIEMDKTNNSSVFLLSPVEIQQRAVFTSGFLDLNGFNADLGTTGHLDGEQENARVIGPNGGEVLFLTTLNAPANSNPANLGAIISSTENLGNVMIKRGHQSQSINSGVNSSVLRYYEILPANNSNLNATLKFKYFDRELNGLTENSLVFLNSNDGINWSAQGFTSRDVTANFVEKAGIGSFSRWTLSNINTVLPVFFTLFNANCNSNKLFITWKTAQEQNSDHFNVEKSDDGIHWTVIGVLNAAGNSTTETSYSFTYNNPGQNDFYRIAEYDLDGTIHYTSTIRSSCNTPDVFRVWPNPFHEKIFVNILVANQSQAIIKLFDSKGALVKLQKTALLQGTNQFSVDLGPIAKSIYQLQIEWNNGQMKKTIQLVNQ